MKRASIFIAAVAVACGESAVVHAAEVTGTVTAPDGAAFRAAFVQAENTQTKVLVSALSDTQGRYRIPNLPAGEYRVQVRAPGFAADPKSSVKMDAGGSFTYAVRLLKDMVRWTDISQYQGTKLFPAALGNNVLRGKDVLVGRCFACHAFQTRMASYKRDIDGWRDRVNFMRGAMHFFPDGAQRFSAADADAVTH